MAAASSSRRILGLASTLRPCLPSTHQLIRSRALHSLPPLPEMLQEGKGCLPLLSASAVDLLWKDWQYGLLTELNKEVIGTQWENASIVDTVIGTAKDPHSILAFNYASLALNNSFFLSNLKSKDLPAGARHWRDSPHPSPHDQLKDALERNFGSIGAFKLAFSSAAYGMSGSGYVWLAMDKDEVMSIVPTYGAGTILIQNRMQRDGAREEWLRVSDIVRNSPSDSTSSATPTQGLSSSSSRRMSTSARAQRMSSSYNSAMESIETRGEELFPLLCVSVHERDWLSNYQMYYHKEGKWGKEKYLETFWECVNWERVGKLWNKYRT